MACIELKHLQTVLATLDVSKADVANAAELTTSVSSSLCAALSTLVDTTGSSKLAFEVDGYGSMYYMVGSANKAARIDELNHMFCLL